MDILESVIKVRRSVRKFNSKPIPDKVLYRILESARWAPSAGNLQNTKIIIIREKAKKAEIAKACPQQEWVSQAPIILVVCSNAENLGKVFKKKGEFYSIQNTAAVIQTLLLEATALQVSSCWVGAFSENKIKSAINIPSEQEVHAVIPLGYAKEVPFPTRKPDIKTMIFFEKWENERDHLETLGTKFKETMSKFSKK